MFRHNIIRVLTCVLLATLATHPAGASPASSSQLAKAALDRVDSTLKNTQSLSFQAHVTVTIQTPPGHPAEHEEYTVSGVFQHEVYAHMEETRAGKTLLVLSSNPQHLYVYSPVSRIYLDCGNVPVYFAIADMLTSGGTSDDKQCPASEEAGYFTDIWGYFWQHYGEASPWGNIEGNEPTPDSTLATGRWKGRKVPCVTVTTRGETYKVTSFMYIDPKTGLPLGITLSGEGPAVTGSSSKARSRITIEEDYSVFKPSNQTLPLSSFNFTPPAGSQPYPQNEDPSGSTSSFPLGGAF